MPTAPDFDVRDFALFVDVWQRKRFTEHLEPFVKLAVVTEELGEVADAMLDYFDNGDTFERFAHLEEEVADVIIAVIGLAGILRIDVSDAVNRKLVEVMAR